MIEDIKKPDPHTSKNETLKANPRQKPDEAGSSKMVDKGEVSEFFKTAIIAVLLALIIRTFLYEPFNIPSGSMFPTLRVGDYLFVSKPAYGYSRHSFPFGIADFEGRIAADTPKRGDVVVFKLPTDTSTDYIKRVVGLPGETVQVIRGRLYIDGTIVEREPVGFVESDDNIFSSSGRTIEYIETLPGNILHSIYEETDNGPLDNTKEYKVPQGHYFVMGDNRDNSQDSRVQDLVGFVPFENLVGRADILFFSVDETVQLFNPLTWPKGIRFDRLFDTLGPTRLDVRAKEE